MTSQQTNGLSRSALLPVIGDAVFGGVRAESRGQALLRDGALILGGSVLMALLAQVVVPFYPVPVTGQTLGVLLVGMLLGARRAALSMCLYLAQGAAGLPVFAGGAAGAIHLMGPTAGYLFAFVPAAMLVGSFARLGFDRKVLPALFAMTLGTLVIFAGGLAVLYAFAFSGAGAEGGAIESGAVLSLGLYPFIPGAIVKMVLAALLLPAGWKLLRAMGEPEARA